ncbi:F-box protein GID2-like isoform X1 [Helianthus annuus]|uniref:F-box protein GID2-like isoform X2 n=1 Tax=Helianthus annuus TaxID=4232 RepID=UPI000B8F3486|nr:F-box protein GID2-like isoform X2 [Helianthus annuus]XP_021994263.1 F-box protein GID2-like isoform X1 [Helianthus annuus]
MKRSITLSEDQNYMDSCNMKKKIRQDQIPKTVTVADETSVGVLLDENLLYEVLKHVDARTLGAVGCVNKLFNRTAQDERLWELICTQHWAKIGSNNNNDQFRAVVLALGGFRRLYSHYLWPLSKPSSSSSSDGLSLCGSSSVWPCLPPQQPRTAKPPAAKSRWGKDEVQLSLCLLSIRFYEKMNSSNRKSN